MSANDFNTFSDDSNCILKAFSLICGNWYGGQRFIVTSYDILFNKIVSVHFYRSSDSLITNHKIIDSLNFVLYMKRLGHENVKISENNFPSHILSNIAQKIQNENELDRTLSLILEGNESKSTILRTCSYFVAIETLCSVISKTNKEFFKPIKKPIISEKLKKKIETVVQKFKKKLDANEFDSIIKKTKYLNSPSNMDKIIKSFELYEINLPKPLLKLIKTRNLYLHGKTPFNEHVVRDKNYELGINSLKLHMLVNTLFLKYCGYSGHIKNLAGYKIYQDNKDDESFKMNEPIYYTI